MTRTDLACRFLAASGALAWRARRLRAGTLTILAYHRVVQDRPGVLPFDDEVVSCTPAEFEREMEFVARHWRVLSFADLHAGGDNGRPGLIVTFDDGYKDNHDVVLPILLKTGVKATFFVTTACMDGELLPWWDEVCWRVRQSDAKALSLESWTGPELRTGTPAEQSQSIAALLCLAKGGSDDERLALLAALRRCTPAPPAGAIGGLMMNWDDVRDLARRGMEIGSHSVTHPILGNIGDAGRLESELRGSKRRIEQKTGRPVTALSYPVGRMGRISDALVDAVRSAGYRYACAYEHGVNTAAGADRFRLRRVKAEVGSDFARFRAKVLFPEWIRY